MLLFNFSQYKVNLQPFVAKKHLHTIIEGLLKF